MLGLATHEVFFTILREEVTFKNDPKCSICGAIGHWANDCTGAVVVESKKLAKDEPKVKGFQFLHIDILREYLSKELLMKNLPFTYNFENIVDDFVFMCFFCGNDFLPHLPSLEIKEGAIDELLRIYRRILPALGGYLTENGKINLSRVDVFLSEVAVLEDLIFKARAEAEEKQKSRDKQNRDRVDTLRNKSIAGSIPSPMASPMSKVPQSPHNPPAPPSTPLNHSLMPPSPFLPPVPPSVCSIHFFLIIFRRLLLFRLLNLTEIIQLLILLLHWLFHLIEILYKQVRSSKIKRTLILQLL